MPLPPSIDTWDGYGHSDGKTLGGSGASIQEKATQIGVFIEQGRGGSYGYEGLAYKNAGFGGLVVTYQLAHQVQRSRSIGYWAGNQYISRQDQWDVLANDGRNFLYRSEQGALEGDPAERLYYTTSGGIPMAYVDPDGPDIPALMGEAGIDILENQPGTDGLWLDNINHNLENPLKKSTTGQIWSGRGERYTSDTFRGAVRRSLAAMRVIIFNERGVMPIIGGNIIGMTYGSSSTANVKITEWVELDFPHDESLFGYGWTNPPAYWSAPRMDYMIGQYRDWLAGNPERFVMLTGQANSALKDDLQHMRYLLGLALVIRPTVRSFTKFGRRIPYVTQRFSYAPGAGYGNWWPYADTEVQLGDPTGPAVKVGQEWVRPYTNGEVKVNTTTRNASFTVGNAPPPPANGPYGAREAWFASNPLGTEFTAMHGADVAVDDDMFGVVVTRNAQSNPTFADWAPFGTPVRSNSSISVHVFHKKAVLADANPGAFYTVNNDRSAGTTIMVLAYPGLHATPLDLQVDTNAPAFLGAIGSGTAMSAPSLKPQHGIVLVTLFATAWGYANMTPPQGMNQRAFSRQNDVSISMLASDQQFPSGAVTGIQVANTEATGTHAAISFGLRLATAAAPATPPTIVQNGSGQPAITKAWYDDTAGGTAQAIITPDPAVTTDDLMVVHAANRNTASIAQVGVTFPSGWLEAVPAVHRNNSHSGRVFYKFREAGEAGGYTIGLAAAADIEVQMIPVRNADRLNPFPNGSVTSSSNSAAGATPQPIVHPAVVAASNSLQLLLGGMSGTQGSFTPPAAPVFTELNDQGHANIGMSIFASYRTVVAAENPTTAVSTLGTSFTGSNIGFTLAIKGKDSAAVTLPPKPTLTQAVAGGVLTLNWPLIANATSVRVERATDDGPFVPVPNNGTLAGSAVTVSYPLVPGTYRHRIYGANNSGPGPYSDTVTTTITGLQAVTTELRGRDGILVTWSPSTFSEGEIRIERSRDAGTSWELVRQAPSAVFPLGQIVDTGGVPGQTYRHRVAAIVGGKNTGWVYSTDRTIPAVVPPVDPPGPIYSPSQLPAVAAIVYDQYHSLTDGTLTTIVSHSGISDHPDRKSRAITAPYQDGVNDLGFVLDARTFQLAFNLTGKDAEGKEIAAKRQQLLDLLEPADDPITLRFDMLSGGVYLIDAHFSTMSSGPITKEGDYVQRVVVTFEAPDPSFRELEQIVVPFQLSISNRGFTVPLPIPLSIGSSTMDVTTAIEYKGHSYARPVISISGPVTGLVIANETIGSAIVFKPDYVIGEGEAVTIDTRRGYIEVVNSAGEDISDALSEESELASFMLASRKFVRGGINQIRVSGVGASPLTRVFLTYSVRRLAIT